MSEARITLSFSDFHEAYGYCAKACDSIGKDNGSVSNVRSIHYPQECCKANGSKCQQGNTFEIAGSNGTPCLRNKLNGSDDRCECSNDSPHQRSMPQNRRLTPVARVRFGIQP